MMYNFILYYRVIIKQISTMNTNIKTKKGFTLLEILLVIAAIGILAAIVLVAINPNRQLAQARNAQRRSDVQTILNAVYQRIIDDAAAGSTTFRDSIPTTVSEIYRDGTTAGTTNCIASQVNIGTSLVSTYIAAVPQDPTEPTASNCSGYQIVRDTTSQRITVTALNAELPPVSISITR
jgi:type IV pilus assembly protein PilA